MRRLELARYETQGGDSPHKGEWPGPRGDDECRGERKHKMGLLFLVKKEARPLANSRRLGARWFEEEGKHSGGTGGIHKWLISLKSGGGRRSYISNCISTSFLLVELIQNVKQKLRGWLDSQLHKLLGT